jgi:hypothetical protein
MTFPSRHRALAVATAILVTVSVPGFARRPFSELTDLIEDREAIVVEWNAHDATVYSVTERGAQKLFTTPLTRREQDVFGGYLDAPPMTMTSNRDRLIFEAEDESSGNPPKRKLYTYDFESAAIEPYTPEYGADTFARQDQIESNLSIHGRFFAGECTEATGAAERKSALVLAKVMEEEKLRGVLGNSLKPPALDDPALADSIKRMGLLKTYVRSDEWKHAPQGAYTDIRNVAWAPDGKSFEWLETNYVVQLVDLHSIGTTLYSYDVATHKTSKLASFDSPAIPGVPIANPIVPVSDRYTILVTRNLRWKKPVYMNLLLDAESAEIKKILPGHRRVIGIR